MAGNWTFSSGDLSSQQERWIATAESEARELTPQKIGDDPHVAISDLLRKRRLEPTHIDRDAVLTDIHPQGAGFAWTVSVPFTGGTTALVYLPDVPMGEKIDGEIDGNKVLVSRTSAELPTIDQVRGWAASVVDALHQYVEANNRVIEAINRELTEVVTAATRQRAEDLERLAQMREELKRPEGDR